jgi:hypothetical protein
MKAHTAFRGLTHLFFAHRQQYHMRDYNVSAALLPNMQRGWRRY